MKKAVSVLITLCILCSFTAVFASDARISINGTGVDVPADMGEIIISDSRTFIPVRFVLEHFDYLVEWFPEDKQIMGTNSQGNLFMMQVGNPVLFFKSPSSTDTSQILMDVAPFIDAETSRTYIPARFLIEAMGYNVDFDDASKTVLITNK